MRFFVTCTEIPRFKVFASTGAEPVPSFAPQRRVGSIVAGGLGEEVRGVCQAGSVVARDRHGSAGANGGKCHGTAERYDSEDLSYICNNLAEDILAQTSCILQGTVPFKFIIVTRRYRADKTSPCKRKPHSISSPTSTSVSLLQEG